MKNNPIRQYVYLFVKIWFIVIQFIGNIIEEKS